MPPGPVYSVLQTSGRPLFYELSVRSAITVAYLLFSLIFVKVLLFCYVVLFLHNYCTFPSRIKTVNRIGSVSTDLTVK